jgi:uncharacterized YccA/Bax inhibitor family protein
MRSSNPVLRNVSRQTYITDRPVTYANVAYKSIFLIALVMVSAVVTINYGAEFLSIGTLIGAFIVAFISVIIGTRSVRLSPIFSSIYAICEGFILGIVSAILSAFFLLVDFSLIENCVESGTDSKYGWILSLGLLVTIVWIYVEILRLLAIFSRRN